MALLVAPPSKPKPSQFPPLQRLNPLKITQKHQDSIHFASSTRLAHNSLKNGLFFKRKDAKIKTVRPIFCAASIPVSGEGNFGRILLSDVVVKKKRNMFWGRKWSFSDITPVGVVVTMHLLCVLAPFTFHWGAFWIAVGLYVITGLLGITLSYHINLSHRSFKLPKCLEYFFAYCGVLAFQGSPIYWVSIHRYHQSSIEGFWFSHMSWIFDTKARAEKCGEQNNVGDLKKQSFYKFLQITSGAHPIALAALLYAIGGLPYLVWGMGVRIVWTYHVTWLVNSASHVWGKQVWNMGDLSRNNWYYIINACRVYTY